jgi:hypothetical protein
VKDVSARIAARHGGDMTDLLFLLVVVVFFAVAVLLVGACDRIIGPDPVAAPAEDDDASDTITCSPERALVRR